MIATLLVAGLALQAQPVGWFVPDEKDVHFQVIAKVDGEKDWPFVAERGRLVCVSMTPGPAVMFVPDGEGDDERPLILDVNPYGMLINNMGRTKPGLLPYGGKLEELIRRVAPFVAMGHMLCKQKDGPAVPGSEL